jgi:hypothetical protein
MEIEIKEEKEDTLPNEEPIWGEGLPEDQWISSKVRKNVKKHNSRTATNQQSDACRKFNQHNDC